MLIKVNAGYKVPVIGYIWVMNKRRLYLSVALMLLAILAVATFQAYWLGKNFREQKRDLSFRTNVMFREAIQHMRTEKLRLDTDVNLRYKVALNGAVGMIDAMQNKVTTEPPVKDKKRYRLYITEQNAAFFNERIPRDSIHEIHVFDKGAPGPPRQAFIKILRAVDSLQDSISVKELSAKYAQMIKREHVAVPFSITSHKSVLRKEFPPDPEIEPRPEPANEVTIGFNHPVTYRLEIFNATAFVLRKMWSQIMISLLLVGLTVLSFSLLLRSLVQQRKLTQIKNDFISNITHELKTPIATVSVAIEALRNFDALHDPQRTKEYLAISSNELQRLSFLVDKVLKLSMFEKHQVELKAETVDLAKLVNEVTGSMKLQFEKYKAEVNVQLYGNRFMVNADKLHLTSVLFNLLDNALKYSKENPSVHIDLKEDDRQIELFVTDNGIGIASEYRKKIFEKFFRVPMGDMHNVKGYGLGLSYVAYVIQQHQGTIEVESEPGIGSRFIIKLPAAT
jgi:two-component system phosphate regulon sensor histidine kinase PhoR